MRHLTHHTRCHKTIERRRRECLIELGRLTTKVMFEVGLMRVKGVFQVEKEGWTFLDRGKYKYERVSH